MPKKNQIPKIKLSEAQTERLKATLLSYIEEAEEFHSEYEDVHENFMRMYLTIPQEKSRSWPWENASNLFLPLGRVILDGLLAQYYDAMFSNDPFIKVAGTEMGDLRAAEDLSLFYGEYVYQKVIPFKSVSNDFLFNLSCTGTSAFLPRWDRREEVNRRRLVESEQIEEQVTVDIDGVSSTLSVPTGETREVVVEKAFIENVEKPVVDVLDINTLYIPPDCDMTLQWPGCRYYYTEHFLTEEEVLDRKNRLGYEVPDGVLAQFRENTVPAAEALQREAEGVAPGVGADTTRMLEFKMRFPLPGTYYRELPNGETEEVVSSGDEDDPLAEEIIVNFWADTKEIARIIPLSRISPSNRRPGVDGRHTRLPGFFYGMGIMAKMEMLNAAMNSSYNQMVDYGTLQNLPFYFYEPQVTGLMPDQFPLEPGAGIPVNSARGLMFPRMQGDSGFFMQMMNSIQSWAERDSSVSDPLLGRHSSMPNAPRTLGQQQGQFAQANIAFSRQIALLVEPFLEVFRQVHEHYRRHMGPEMSFRYFNRESEMFEQKTLTSDMFEGDVDFTFVLNPNRAADQENAMMVFNLMSSIPMVQQNPTAVRALGRDLYTAIGKKNFDEIWPEQQAPQVGAGQPPVDMTLVRNREPEPEPEEENISFSNLE